MAVRLERQGGERFLGFGERSDQVVRSRGEVQNRVTEGPYQPSENAIVRAFVPPRASTTAPTTTYFPIPWVVSTRGCGFLVDENRRARFDLLNSAESVDVEAGAQRFALHVFAGPRPADVVRRYTADVGRQPVPAAAGLLRPMVCSPTATPGPERSARWRRAGALGSLVQTYTHYLPCGDHRASRAGAARTRPGTTPPGYQSPLLQPDDLHDLPAGLRRAAARRRWLNTNPQGNPYLYPYRHGA